MSGYLGPMKRTITSWMVRPLVAHLNPSSDQGAVNHFIGVLTAEKGLPHVISCGPVDFPGLSIPLTKLDQTQKKLYLTSIHFFTLLRGDWLRLLRTGVLRTNDGPVIRLIKED